MRLWITTISSFKFGSFAIAKLRVVCEPVPLNSLNKSTKAEKQLKQAAPPAATAPRDHLSRHANPAGDRLTRPATHRKDRYSSKSPTSHRHLPGRIFHGDETARPHLHCHEKRNTLAPPPSHAGKSAPSSVSVDQTAISSPFIYHNLPNLPVPNYDFKQQLTKAFPDPQGQGDSRIPFAAITGSFPAAICEHR